MPLKSNIFTGVTFRKILGFYYKRKRQLFYYEGISLKTLKIPERVNRVIYQNSSVAYDSIPADKSMFKVDKKGMFQECYSGVFMITLENIFEVCDGV